MTSHNNENNNRIFNLSNTPAAASFFKTLNNSFSSQPYLSLRNKGSKWDFTVFFHHDVFCWKPVKTVRKYHKATPCGHAIDLAISVQSNTNKGAVLKDYTSTDSVTAA